MQQSSDFPAAQASGSRATTGLSLSTITQIAGAFLLGLVLLYGAAFASMDAAHNAAHDSRHAFAFPCH